MSEENKRTVRSTLTRKFGVSEKKDERRPRKDDGEGKKFGDRPTFGGRRDGERAGFRSDRPRGLREDGSKREEFGRRGEGDGRFDRERRPRRFGDRPFGRREGGRFGDRFGKRGDRPFRSFDGAENAPVYRQRPEQKEAVVDENIDEAALEARAAQAETAPESAGNPPWFRKLLAITTEKGREREGRFLGEGVHVVDELVTKHREIVIAIYVAEDFENEALIEKINDADITIHVLEADKMKRAAAKLYSDGVVKYAPEFHFCDRDQLRKLAAEADIYVHCANVEVEGLSALEALQQGPVPVIAQGELTATAQFALDSRSLFPAGDARALAERLDYWIEHPEERIAMGPKYVESMDAYDIHKSIESLIDMFHKACSA